MRTIASRNVVNLRKRNWQALSTWLFTILLLAGGFGLYSYLYVHQREQYFAENKLRELRLLGDQLKLRIENIANKLRTSLYPIVTFRQTPP